MGLLLFRADLWPVQLDHNAAGNKIVYRPFFGVEADGEKGEPSQERLEQVSEKGLYYIDAFGWISVVPDPDLFYILSECASKDDEQGLIDCPDTKEQNDPDPTGGIVAEQGGEYEHEHDNEDPVDEDGLDSVQQERVFVFWDIIFGEKIFFHSSQNNTFVR